MCASLFTLLGCNGFKPTTNTSATGQAICTPTIPLSTDAPTQVRGTCATKVTFTWTAPTTNTDGTPIGNNLGGYDIYYSTSSSMGVLNVPDKCATQYEVFYFAPNTYDFSMTAQNTQGAQGPFSKKITFTVQPCMTTEINLTTGKVTNP